MDGTQVFEVVTRDNWPDDWARVPAHRPAQPLANGPSPDPTFVPACLTGDCPVCAPRPAGQDAPSGFVLPRRAGDPADRYGFRALQPKSHALVADITWAAPRLFRLLLEPVKGSEWIAGQTILLLNPAGAARPYAIASPGCSDQVEVHARHRRDGEVSDYLAQLLPGDILDVSEPTTGTCYMPAMAQHPLVLVGTGAAVGALVAIARTALESGHDAPVKLVHGAEVEGDLYMRDELTDLALEHPQFNYDCLPQTEAGPQAIASAAFGGEQDLSDTFIFLRGAPDIVAFSRMAALKQGACLGRILDAPYFAYRPQSDADRRASSDPDLWAALGSGEKLAQLLTDFNARRAETDAKAVPLEIQCEALAAALTGTGTPRQGYDTVFGGDVDVLFDVARDHGITDDAIDRWREFHRRLRG